MPIRLLLYALILPYYVFEKLGIWYVWFIITVPFDFSWIVAVISSNAAVRLSAARNAAATTADEIRRARVFEVAAFTLAAAAAGLSGELSASPHFDIATAQLTDKSTVTGEYVAYTGGTLYLGVSHRLRVVTAADLRTFSVHAAPDHAKSPNPLVVRLFDLL